jgi:peptide/nickel transport system substrate-binding protein
MRRRHFLTGTGMLAAPSIVRAQNSRVLRYASTAGVVQLDPLSATIGQTTILGLQIFESLYAVDESLQPRLQMAAGHAIEDGGRRWVIRLRDGQRFHDGEPVLARDCVASINRWMKRDPNGHTLASRVDALEAPDDKTVVFRLSKPFHHLPAILGKASPYLLAMMPERLAVTDPGQPVKELVGSGPYRFVANEFSANSLTVLSRFEAYRPRDEKPSGTSGGKLAKLERIEWRVIPEPSTEVNALMTGEVDWMMPPPDSVPLLQRNRDIVVDVRDTFGGLPFIRPNHFTGPTANVGVRRAIMAALDGKEIISAGFGDHSGAITAPVGVFAPGSPYETRVGMKRLGPKPPAEIRSMLNDAGYQGERLVLLHHSDVMSHNAMLQVIAKRLSEAGFNVDDQVMDLATMVKRRNSRETLDNGGWSLFFQVASCADLVSPLNIGLLRTGDAALFGWPNNPVMEELRERWLDSTDEAELRQLCVKLQETALADVDFVPLGRFVGPWTWRSNVEGILKMHLPVMWNISKA